MKLIRLASLLVVVGGAVGLCSGWISLRKADAMKQRRPAIRELEAREEKLREARNNLTREEYLQEAYHLQQEYSAIYRKGELEMDLFFLDQSWLLAGIQLAAILTACMLFLFEWYTRTKAPAPERS